MASIPRNAAAALCLMGLLFLPSCCAPYQDWDEQLESDLRLLGHRNWIVVADSAYPAQISPGLATAYAGGDLLATVEMVLDMIRDAGHVRPLIHLDQELEQVCEADAPGIDRYRDRLHALLESRNVVSEPHEELIGKLETTARRFNVLVLKTDCKLPYTSVFIEFDCGYWSAEAEGRMRDALDSAAAEEPSRRRLD